MTRATKQRDNRTQVPHWHGILVVLAVAAAGALTAIIGTSEGPWAYSDGVGYMTIARNIVDGFGIGTVNPSGQFEPLVSHSPGYPLVLAGLLKFGLPVITAVRIVDVASLAAFLGLVAWAVLRLSGSTPAALLTAVLLAVTPSLIYIFLSAMAEPLFLVTGFLSLFLLVEHIVSGSRRALIGSAALTALCILFRYPGIAFAMAEVVIILSQPSPSLKAKSKRAATHASIALIPIGAFAVSRFTLAGGLVPKTLSADGSASITRFIRSFLSTAWSWKPIPPDSVLDILVPGQYRPFILPLLLIMLTLGVIGMAAGAWRGRHSRPSQPWGTRGVPVLTLGLFVLSAAYILLYAIVYLLVYPTPDVNSRTLLPLLPCALIVSILLGRMSVQTQAHRRLMISSALLTYLAVLIGYGFMTYDIVGGLHVTGEGYTGVAWRESETLSAVLKLNPDRPLASNAPEAILLYSGRHPYSLNELPAGDDCPTELNSLVSRGVLVVSFDPDALSGAIGWAEPLRVSACGLLPIAAFADGTIYGR